jgi:hypothetical protein
MSDNNGVRVIGCIYCGLISPEKCAHTSTPQVISVPVHRDVPSRQVVVRVNAAGIPIPALNELQSRG